MWWKKNDALQKQVNELEKRVEYLEQQNNSLSLVLQNLQSAIVALSRSHDHVAGDVTIIKETVTSVLHDIDPAGIMMMYGKYEEDEPFN